MRRSIPPGCVARRLNSLLFALLAPCHAGASTPENVKLFLREPLVILYPTSSIQHVLYNTQLEFLMNKIIGLCIFSPDPFHKKLYKGICHGYKVVLSA